MTWPLTFYVKSLPPNVGGCANGPVIRILEKYRNDRDIYEHELVHVRQWFRTLGVLVLQHLGLGALLAYTTTVTGIVYEAQQWYRKDGAVELLDAVATAATGWAAWGVIELLQFV